MVRVGRRPCPNFPRHCFYILTNPQIFKEWLQMRRPRLTRTTRFMKILMPDNQPSTLNQLRSKITSLMSLTLSQNVRPVQVQGQGQTRTRSPSNYLDPKAVLNSLQYTLETENEIKPRTRSSQNQKVGQIKVQINLESLFRNCL
jgi:hypothetical protein